MFKIEEENPERKSNQDIYDAVNRGKAKPAASPVKDPLEDLEQFEMYSSPQQPRASSRYPQAPEPTGLSDVPEPPSYNQPNYSTPSFPTSSSEPFTESISQPQLSTDYIQQVIEEVLEEKWDDLMGKVGDIRLWKSSMDTEITSIKQEIMRTRDQFSGLQKAILGKVTEYNENILNINTEMKALEKVFEKILSPLTQNIKELSKITSKLKTKKV